MKKAHQLTDMYKSTIEETLGLIANDDDVALPQYRSFT